MNATGDDPSAIVPFSIRLPADEPGGAQRDIGVELNISELLTNDADLSAARRAFDPWGNPVAESALLQFDTTQQTAAAHRAQPPGVQCTGRANRSAAAR